MENTFILNIVQSVEQCNFLYNPLINSYTLTLENSPHYEKEVLPNDLQHCPYLKDWLEREIAVYL